MSVPFYFTFNISHFILNLHFSFIISEILIYKLSLRGKCEMKIVATEGAAG